jgi:VHL beta domain
MATASSPNRQPDATMSSKMAIASSPDEQPNAATSSLHILWRRAPAWRYLIVAATCLTGLAIIHPPKFTATVPWAHPAPTRNPVATFPIHPAPAGEAKENEGTLTCSNENNLRSPLSSQQTTVRFQNQTDSPLHIYWLDFSGTRKPYGDLEAGAERIQPTFTGHLWVLTDMTGQCASIVQAAPTLATVTGRKTSPTESPSGPNKP